MQKQNSREVNGLVGEQRERHKWRLDIVALCKLKCYCSVLVLKKTPLKHPSSQVLQILGVTKKHFINSSGEKNSPISWLRYILSLSTKTPL